MKSDNKMFTWFKPLSAQEVAREGYNALMKGKAVCVTKPRYRAFKSDEYVNLILSESRCYVEIAAHNPLSCLDGIDISDLKISPVF